MFLGDSWFWYPISNLPRAIHASFSTHDFLVIGRNGADAAEWKDKFRKDIDRIINADCSKAASVKDCYQPGQPESLLSGLFGAHKAVILKFRAHNPRAPVLLHNYHNAWPSGKGLFGIGASRCDPNCRHPAREGR